MNPELPQLLAARLAAGLPRPAAGSPFIPRPEYWSHYDPPPPQARAAAVLALLYPWQDQWHVPLILRPAQAADHPGQISLPGGAVEAGESTCQAALREFHEELGATGHQIEVLGQLTPLCVRASNFHVTPWVAATGTRPLLVPNPAEVEALLEVPLAHLIDPANLSSHRRRYQGQPYTAPHFAWQTHRIWGATCMILGELVSVVEEAELGIGD